jgi:hypothetical protein
LSLLNRLLPQINSNQSERGERRVRRERWNFALEGYDEVWLKSPSLRMAVVGYPSGQRGQTVNLLAYAFAGSNPAPTTTQKERMKVQKKTLMCSRSTRILSICAGVPCRGTSSPKAWPFHRRPMRQAIFLIGGACWFLFALGFAAFLMQYIAQGAGLQFYAPAVSSGSVLLGLVHVVGFVIAVVLCFAIGAVLCAHGIVPEKDRKEPDDVA